MRHTSTLLVFILTLGCSGGGSNAVPANTDSIDMGNVANFQEAVWGGITVATWTDGSSMPPYQGVRIFVQFTRPSGSNIPFPKTTTIRVTASGTACGEAGERVFEHKLVTSDFTTKTNETRVAVLNDSVRSDQFKWTSHDPTQSQLKLRAGKLKLVLQLASDDFPNELEVRGLEIDCREARK